MASLRTRPVAILLIEDRRSDVRLVQYALQEIDTLCNLTVCEDGEQALAYLRRDPPYETAPRPDLILLDLQLPKIDGLAVLAALKCDVTLCRIPVIIFTDSQDVAAIAESYRLQASSYVIKPATLDRLLDVMKAIDTFWFSVVTLFEEAEPTAAALLQPASHAGNGVPTSPDPPDQED